MPDLADFKHDCGRFTYRGYDCVFDGERWVISRDGEVISSAAWSGDAGRIIDEWMSAP